MTLFDRMYRLLFVVGVALFGLGIGLGVYESLANRRRLPPVYIDYAQELERVVAEHDYRRAVEELRLAARIDYFSHRPRHYFELCKTAHRMGDRETQQFALESLRAMFDANAIADARIYYYLSVAVILKPKVTERDLLEALGFAIRAIEEEPEFAPAHANMGQILAVLATSGDGPPNFSELRQAAFHCQKALELAPSNVDAKQTLADIEQVFRSVESQ